VIPLVPDLRQAWPRATGVSVLSPELDAKRLELLHQLAPRARRVNNLRSLVNPLAGRELETVGMTARALGLQLEVLNAPSVSGLDVALNMIRRKPQTRFLCPLKLSS